MDAGRLEQQVASVDRGICFLKQEHLAMLTGLQLEITHLKRRCHELSCELDSKFPDRNTAEEEAELAARCEAAERLLERQQCMMVTVRGELRAGRARAVALGRSLREEERRFLEELKRRSHKITLLNRELQRQNVMTTTLHHELHGARLKLFQQRQRGKREQEEEEEEEEEGASDWPLSPHPGASSVQPEGRPRKNMSVREERVPAPPLEPTHQAAGRRGRGGRVGGHRGQQGAQEGGHGRRRGRDGSVTEKEDYNLEIKFYNLASLEMVNLN
ncbi:coiled-coil domain-containing protein 92 isoform X2 [Poeciliopsis prolifica]|uniref:coiled-coil domain-containing protein 92 isoform X2 n=1 Tax=Poeciliopsis prolifica TaxID=188132 RepID=UPI002413B7D4|nr:coiled-coil domain-containing protein 92 isoform X2 [Poeciliopsis prolifica]